MDTNVSSANTSSTNNIPEVGEVFKVDKGNLVYTPINDYIDENREAIKKQKEATKDLASHVEQLASKVGDLTVAHERSNSVMGKVVDATTKATELILASLQNNTRQILTLLHYKNDSNIFEVHKNHENQNLGVSLLAMGWLVVGFMSFITLLNKPFLHIPVSSFRNLFNIVAFIGFAMGFMGSKYICESVNIKKHKGLMGGIIFLSVLGMVYGCAYLTTHSLVPIILVMNFFNLPRLLLITDGHKEEYLEELNRKLDREEKEKAE